MALGFNFNWITKISENEKLPTISFKINQIDDLSQIFADHELNYGCIVKLRRDPYLLNFNIESQEGKSLTYNFNYHQSTKTTRKKRAILLAS